MSRPTYKSGAIGTGIRYWPSILAESPYAMPTAKHSLKHGFEHFGIIRRSSAYAAPKSFGRLPAMICRGLGVCLTLLAVFGGGPRLSVCSAAAEASYWSITSPLAAGKKSAGNVEQGAGTEAGWRLIRGGRTETGERGAAILHTADFERSDPRLAGLMVRCGGTQGIETVIIVVEPFSPHAQPQVSLRTSERTFEFAGSIIPTGAGIRVPLDAVKLAALGLVKAGKVEIKVTTDGPAINGIVALTGLPKALAWLNGECIQK